MASVTTSRTVKKVKIWQFLDIQLGCWRYLSAEQCKCLQDASDRHQATINLEGKLKINFPNNEMEIITNSNQTGNLTIMPIRKVDVSVDSLIAKGIIWEWNAGHDLWIAFREDANALIEKEFGTNGKKKSWRNSSKPLNLAIIGLPYKIDVIKLRQKNIHSGRERKIRRQVYSSYLNFLPTVDVEVDQLQLSTISQQQTLDNSHNQESNNRQNSTSTNVSKNSKNLSKQKSHNEKYKTLADYILLVASDNLPDDELCTICYESLSAASGFETQDGTNQIVQLSQCQHYFHEPCIEACVNNNKSDHLECPKCRTLHGLKTGNQPPGTMNHHIQEGMQIPGFNSSSTIIITYDFNSGVQGKEHPHPGKKYRANAFPRVAYLPNNPEGQRVLRMLKLAWDRRLIFTIGRSSTSGADNVIIWNDIHHKTSWNSNYGGHGYPDPGYLQRVTEELRAQGIR